jgi:hypothetical protein
MLKNQMVLSDNPRQASRLDRGPSVHRVEHKINCSRRVIGSTKLLGFIELFGLLGKPWGSGREI